MNILTPESAALYDSVSSIYQQNRLARVVVNEADFEQADVVLDVGCGTGVVTKQVASQVRFITGFDISPEMIDHALANNTANNIQYMVQDAMKFGDDLLVEWNEKFDKILSTTTLHWIRDQQKVLRNVYHCLKPGGKICLGFVLQSQLTHATCCHGDTVDEWVKRHPKWSHYFTNQTSVELAVGWENRESFLSLLESVGYTVLKAEVLPKIWTHWNKALVTGQVKLLVPHTKHVPEDLRDDFVDDVCEWLYEVSPKSEDGMVLGELGQIEYMVVVAEK